jgi:hypothetical protein
MVQTPSSTRRHLAGEEATSSKPDGTPAINLNKTRLSDFCYFEHELPTRVQLSGRMCIAPCCYRSPAWQWANCHVWAHLVEQCHCDSLSVRVHRGRVSMILHLPLLRICDYQIAFKANILHIQLLLSLY